MDPQPITDGTFKAYPSPEPGYSDFKVARSTAEMPLDDGPAAGATYAAATSMAIRPRVHQFGAYVAAQAEEGPPGYIWQHFTRKLPTTPSVSEGPLDPIWGRVRNHVYRDLISAVRPDRADLFSTSGTTLTLDLVAGGSWEWQTHGTIELASARPVLNVQEKDMGNGLCEVTVITVDNPIVTKMEQKLADETGQKYDVYRTHTLSATSPTGFGTRSDGYFAEVTPVEHNHWLTVQDKVSTLPMGRDAAVEVPTTGSIYWPAVLEGYLFTRITEDDRLTFKKLLTTNIRDPFSSDVRKTVRKWQQTTPYAIDPPTAMLPSSIKVPGHRMSFSIEPTLHGDFSYSEQAYDATNWAGTYYIPTGAITGVSLNLLTFSFGATSHTDWPESVTLIKQTFERGVYLLTEEIYFRPVNYNRSQQTFSSRPWTTSDPWDMPIYG